MGTNYYVVDKEDNRIWHIGKSSNGWCCALHTNEEYNDLNKIAPFLLEHRYRIVDETSTPVPLAEMLDIITRRENYHNKSPEHESTEHGFFDSEYNLRRHKPDSIGEENSGCICNTFG